MGNFLKWLAKLPGKVYVSSEARGADVDKGTVKYSNGDRVELQWHAWCVSKPDGSRKSAGFTVQAIHTDEGWVDWKMKAKGTVTVWIRSGPDHDRKVVPKTHVIEFRDYGFERGKGGSQFIVRFDFDWSEDPERTEVDVYVELRDRPEVNWQIRETVFASEALNWREIY